MGKVEVIRGEWSIYLSLDGEEKRVGSAGNPAFSDGWQVRFLRVGDQVALGAGKILFLIPASTTVTDFQTWKEGKTLAELLPEDVVYDYNLEIDQPRINNPPVDDLSEWMWRQRLESALAGGLEELDYIEDD